ncbi:MAG: ABC transporter permease [Christensenellales bacterium]|jgi:putative aldouronate transport system permease protein
MERTGVKTEAITGAASGRGYWKRLMKDIGKDYDAYILVLPVIAFYLIFAYKPMYGAIIAFKNYSPGLGIIKSPWAGSYGFQHFLSFFNSYYFGRVIKNTLVISMTTLIFGFPAPIILALLLNEVKNLAFKRIVQTISYLPHFISTVVLCSLVRIFTRSGGIINNMLLPLGLRSGDMLGHASYFVPLYVISGIWSEVGWGSIIYLAALSGIDQELYEAARIDGANRWQQTLHVTLPGILGTIIILFILRMGGVMNVGHEKILLLYNEGIYDTADVISTFVYRRGLLDFSWSYSSAVGLFNSVINFMLVVTFNKLSSKFSEYSLW